MTGEILFALGVLCFGVFNLFVVYKRHMEKKKYSDTVEGTCIRIDAVSAACRYGFNYAIYCQYTYKNKDRQEGAMYDLGAKPKKFKEGDQITLYVNPERPNCFMVEKKKIDGTDVLFGVIGVLLIATSWMALCELLK